MNLMKLQEAQADSEVPEINEHLMERANFQFLNGNVLKILALVFMTADHIGMILFPHVMAWRIVGRLAFPIFAFMIAEGCYYTRNKRRYLGLIFAVGVFCQIIAYISQHTLYMCIMITFTMAVLIIFALQKAVPDRNRQEENAAAGVSIPWCLAAAGMTALSYFITMVLPKLLPSTDLHIDYSFFGVTLPVIVYLPNLFMRSKGVLHRMIQALLLAAWILIWWKTCNRYEWVAVFSAVLLLLYNGQRGRFRLKYLFYVYYPAHLGILYLISMITGK